MKTKRELEKEVFGKLSTLKRSLIDVTGEALNSGHYTLAKQLTEFIREIDEEWVATMRGLGGPPTAEVKAEAEEYPKFLVKDGELVRIALRGSGEEYTQTVSRERYKDIISALGKFVEEEALTVADVKEYTDHPEYTLYAVIGVLEKYDLLANPRRGEYAIQSTEFPVEAHRLWDQLAV